MKTVIRYIESLKGEVTFEIGESSEDNFQIIDRAAQSPDDIWFHVQGFSSCHVVAKIHGMKLEKKNLRQIITQGCILAKQYSRYSYITQLIVVYTFFVFLFVHYYYY